MKVRCKPDAVPWIHLPFCEDVRAVIVGETVDKATGERLVELEITGTLAKGNSRGCTLYFEFDKEKG